MHHFATWLGDTPLSLAIQQRTWLVALVQAIHILALSVVFSSMLLIALRSLGRFRADETPEQVWTRFAPWLWRGLAVLAITGLVLIVGEPVRQAGALSFWLKMGLLVLAVLGIRRLRTQPSTALASLVILCWIAIVFLGRAIAYDLEVWGGWHLGS